MPKRKKVFTKTRGALEGRGATKTEAQADLDRQIDWACSYHPTYVETMFGHLIIITPTAQGYQSMVVDPAGLAAHGKVHNATCFSGHVPLNEEVRRMRVHVAQLAWHRGEIDEQFVAAAKLDDVGRDDLQHWIRFQRLYAWHIQAGATPAEAHEKACRGDMVSVNPCVPHSVPEGLLSPEEHEAIK